MKKGEKAPGEGEVGSALYLYLYFNQSLSGFRTGTVHGISCGGKKGASAADVFKPPVMECIQIGLVGGEVTASAKKQELMKQLNAPATWILGKESPP